MAPTTWLITGTSRGIGLALVERLLQDPSNLVVAACRNPEKASALQGLKDGSKGTLHVVKIDVNDAASIHASFPEVASIVGEHGLDYLINNAGILEAEDRAFSMDTNIMVPQFVTNVVGPAVVSQVFVPLVEKSNKKTIINVSSFLASIGHGMGAIYTSYSLTKTALNMLTYKQVQERPDLTIVLLDPGWVQTDMGGPGAPVTITECIDGITKVVGSLTHADSGAYVRYNGERLPW
ncbi:NAD(P)-binding protein [Lentinus tigrinus ALCF2SS1-7]|uniref:NAD(P)-binding protein n=1 Tax=Lentinus tigrinus ALCF2SS1-6 TaxID=1328759 RepID=A0A5C2SBB1_9APHY|nr:NAD(P)-binding protein [Lentinus tigrinus ALCF2SS1-6]RPD70946.1 NAD(P)-binding protein [Lentinus tigrinus ALCF2SS1-7]